MTNRAHFLKAPWGHRAQLTTQCSQLTLPILQRDHEDLKSFRCSYFCDCAIGIRIV